jgi:hypothetical protein
MNPFKVKLFQRWNFPGISGSLNWGGIWETYSLYDLGTDHERWDLRRILASNTDQEIGEIRQGIPTSVLLCMGQCIKFEVIYNKPEYSAP